jgi:hypothetical protein
MWQPPGFDNGSGCVCKLNLALYSLRQLGCEWDQLLDRYLREIEFTPSLVDPCVYHRLDNGSPTFLAVHVNDFSLLTKGRDAMNKLKRELSSSFEMTNLGPVKKILGYEVIQDCNQRMLMMRQSGYIRKFLDRFCMADSNLVTVPIESNAHLVRSPNNSTPSSNVPYQEAIGSLMYAAYGTCPDIAYAMQTLSQFNENPQTSH